MSRELLQQALDAIYDLQGYRPDIDKAIAAIKQELAKLEQTLIKQGWDVDTLLAKPKQEPVALKMVYGEVCCQSKHDDQSFGMWCPITEEDFPNGTPFYTAPPRTKWVGLTDEQIQLMAHNDDKGDWSDLRFRSCWHNGYVDGVHAANDKLKELNT
jgi:hypothetical protein